jgi:hypothetical protein
MPSKAHLPQLSAIALLVLATTTGAAPLVFSTGATNSKMALASRPASAAKSEIESADDFRLTSEMSLTGASFTGHITGGIGSVGAVWVEIYRVFPADSDTGRTSGPPVFGTPRAPTRVNSPSDIAFAERSDADGSLAFTMSVLAPVFTALNSVQPGGIHATPNHTTGGDGPVTGQEVEFDIMFATPLDLPADHYFFVPQVEIVDPAGEFLWLSASRPIMGLGTPFAPDLQAWTRDERLDPDWLRIGTDIVGPPQGGGNAPAFNAAFSLYGTAVAEPGTLALGLAGLALAAAGRRKGAARLRSRGRLGMTRHSAS